jgi:DNA-binding GntR family transcriptional regulator
MVWHPYTCGVAKSQDGQDRAADAYREIRQRILDGMSGSLSEQVLASELAISRTPVREALKRLEREGLVQSLPRRGTFVTELGAHDVAEIYQIRIALETLAAHTAATQMDPEEIARLRAQLDAAHDLARRGRARDAFESDLEFHKRIIAATHNQRLAQILATLDDQVHQIRALALRSPGRLEDALEEHERILRAISQHDPAEAGEAMHAHLRAARETALRMKMPVRDV